MRNNCCGIFGHIFGHNFKPVLTKAATKFDSKGVRCKEYVALQMADKYRDEEYHGSVCSRCGMTNEKE